MAAPAIALNDLTLGYDGHPAVHHLHGAFEQGSLTAIVGPNGSGKSTLLKGITGVLTPLGGAIERDGFEVRDIAYLPQIAEIDRSFPAVVSDLVSLGFWKRRGLFGAIKPARPAGAGRGAAGAWGWRDLPIGRSIRCRAGNCSGRCLRGCCCRMRDVILLDEPFTAIDEKTVADLIGLVQRWHSENAHGDRGAA